MSSGEKNIIALQMVFGRKERGVRETQQKQGLY
jgi:hypothetical protein